MRDLFLSHNSPVTTDMASKPVIADTIFDPLLDHMMSLPREYPVLSEPVQPVFDPVPHTRPDPICHENVEASIPSDTSSSVQLEGHQQGHFCRNSSEDLVGLGERHESDGFHYSPEEEVLERNVRGVGSTATRRRLKKLVQIHQRMSRVKFGAFGIWGLQLLHVLIILQFLHIRVEDPRLSRPMYITPVYASCSPAGRRDLWMGLHQISLAVDGPWMVGGDFNVIAHNGYSGSQYTWTNGRVWKRLDRVLINSVVGSSCSRFSVRHLNRSTSDHSPLLIQWSSDDDLGPRPFSIPQRLDLRWWNRHVFGDIFQRVRDAECRVDKAESIYVSDPTPAHRDILQQAQASLNQTLSIEEAFWKQKAGARWETIQPSAVSFFQDLLSAAPQPVDPIRPDIIPRLVSDEDNLQLNRTPTLAEVREAIFSIDPDSVAGPDGFSSHFFQECWDIISDDVFQAVLNFFAGGHFSRGFSATSIVLIPKQDNACRWSEFRPISLCTVLNKLVTKLLNSRLSTILPQLISAPRSGFIPGRLIGDNILLAP
ncbi:DNAse I-like superfamily protein [Abeliophyllum distichum]|uniref:DNAse I-like superfamily protein n=1 Tax=Abeliophyllum distichum TaxID=126358 RepID=A0ABD1QM21_9LAMI